MEFGGEEVEALSDWERGQVVWVGQEEHLEGSGW